MNNTKNEYRNAADNLYICLSEVKLGYSSIEQVAEKDNALWHSLLNALIEFIPIVLFGKLTKFISEELIATYKYEKSELVNISLFSLFDTFKKGKNKGEVRLNYIIYNYDFDALLPLINRSIVNNIKDLLKKEQQIHNRFESLDDDGDEEDEFKKTSLSEILPSDENLEDNALFQIVFRDISKEIFTKLNLEEIILYLNYTNYIKDKRGDNFKATEFFEKYSNEPQKVTVETERIINTYFKSEYGDTIITALNNNVITCPFSCPKDVSKRLEKVKRKVQKMDFLSKWKEDLFSIKMP